MIPARFTRYILFDVLKMFLLTLVAMTLVISLVFAGQQLIAEGVGWLAILKLLPFIFLIALQFSVPATLLFSVCCVYGRVSADNEIVALKSVGISPLRVFRPAILLGLLLSFPSVWLNDMAVSWGRPQMQKIVMRSVVEILYSVLRSQRSYMSGKGFSIHVAEVQDRWLLKPTIYMYGDATGNLQTITADKAQISLDPNADKIIIELEDSYVETMSSGGEKTTITWPGRQRIDMPLYQATRSGGDTVSPSQYSISQIPLELDKLSNQNNRRRELLASKLAIGLTTARYGQLNDAKTLQTQAELDESKKLVARLKTEPARRWALGFSCLFFVWIGVPMAILIRSADYWWSFGVCFLPILLIYYPLFGLALDRAKDGEWPAISLWLGNLVLLIIGTWLTRRIVRT